MPVFHLNRQLSSLSPLSVIALFVTCWLASSTHVRADQSLTHQFLTVPTALVQTSQTSSDTPLTSDQGVDSKNNGESQTADTDDARVLDLSARAEQAAEQALEKDGFGATEIAATSSWVQSIGIVDWLGPLAPIALSPFFGVTCLSGLAIYGPEWAASNPLLQNAGPLKSPVLFWTFAALTLLTSLPRLTKVSKPFAQAVDKLETYSVIVILLVIKFLPDATTQPSSDVAMIQLGIVSVTVDTLIALAMILNLIVINSVKFFFEFLIWLTPVPFIDAIFEVCNKTASGCLMAIYAFSPTLATGINLILLVIAALILRWIGRHVRFYRTLALDPLLSLVWPTFGKPAKAELIVFPKQQLGPFAPKSFLRLTRHADSEDAWTLRSAAWWLPPREHHLRGVRVAKCRRGWTMHEIELHREGTELLLLHFSRRYGDEELARLLQQLGVQLESSSDVINATARPAST